MGMYTLKTTQNRSVIPILTKYLNSKYKSGSDSNKSCIKGSPTMDNGMTTHDYDTAIDLLIYLCHQLQETKTSEVKELAPFLIDNIVNRSQVVTQ